MRKASFKQRRMSGNDKPLIDSDQQDNKINKKVEK